MRKLNEAPGIVSVLVPPAIIVLTAILLALVPIEVTIVLAVWTLASFPIGMLFGHCVLNEE
jgi:hypothetical protein